MYTADRKIKSTGTVILYCLGIICLISMASVITHAKEFPERSIVMVVNTTPGGAADLWARAWIGEFSKLVKVPVVVNNQGGASTMMALIEATSAPPDGYTMTTISHSMVVSAAITPNPPVDLFKDLTPLGGFGYFYTIMVVEQSSPFKTYEDVVDYAKKNPGKLKCADSGVAMISHFTFELLKQKAQIDIPTVPFAGAPAVVMALLGKHVDLATLPPQAALGFIKSGRLRVLLSTKRQNDYPQVPSFAEKGLKEADIDAWFGLAISSRVSKDRQKKLADAFEKVAKQPKVMERLTTLKYVPDYANATDFLAILKRDYTQISNVAKHTGIGK